MADIADAVEDFTVDVDSFVIGDAVRLVSEEDFAFAGKDVENLVSFVRMGRMCALPGSHFRDMQMEFFGVGTCLKDKAVYTFDIVSNLFFHDNFPCSVEGVLIESVGVSLAAPSEIVNCYCTYGSRVVLTRN